MGLVARVLEANGIATVGLSWIPDLTLAVGVPRLAGIAYPAGRSLGRVGDAEGQRAVLRATLGLLESAEGPGAYVELPFEWPETRAEALKATREHAPPPITELLLRKPWLVPALWRGEIPAAESPRTDSP
ncbi:MAG TPA: hypothetical protein VLV48_00015 [Thermoanaerobaculia bacterium]|nr:hypothetical protein [Thermoanaerobaculia bacterium]